MLTPYEGRARMETGFEANFSFFHSSLRMTVECAFGVLIQLWGCLWRPLLSSLHNNILAVQACSVLHNWCIDRGIPILLAPPTGRHSVRMENRPYIDANGVPVEMLGDPDDVPDGRTGPVSPDMFHLRETLSTSILELDMRRPMPEASFNQ